MVKRVIYRTIAVQCVVAGIISSIIVENWASLGWCVLCGLYMMDSFIYKTKLDKYENNGD